MDIPDTFPEEWTQDYEMLSFVDNVLRYFYGEDWTPGEEK